jgi:hypothetical protein
MQALQQLDFYKQEVDKIMGVNDEQLQRIKELLVLEVRGLWLVRATR